jgi:hypothetical protein
MSGPNIVLGLPVNAVNKQISLDSGGFSASGGAGGDVTNLSITITTRGRPVWVGLIPKGDNNTAVLRTIVIGAGAGESNVSSLSLARGVTTIAAWNIGSSGDGSGGDLQLVIPCGAIWTFDTPAAGTYTYKLVAVKGAGADAFEINNCKLMAFEL